MLVLRRSLEADYFSNKPLFTNRASYLLFVKNWKGSIKYVEHHIRLYKQALHKEAQATDGYKKFAKEQGTGYYDSIWQHWQSQTQIELYYMTTLATRMYALRKEMKQKSWLMKVTKNVA